jgi:two-component system sporulation sensor kinase A
MAAPRMTEPGRESRWFWATLVLSCISIVALVMAFWELVENHFFRDLDYVSLHYLYISRGIASSLLLAAWAAWFVLRQRRSAEQALRRSHERYRGLLNASPGAVVLYDASLRIVEWNAAAERLYGYSRAEIVLNLLPTVPEEKAAELEGLLERVDRGESVLDCETVRVHRDGSPIDVQLSLLPYREGAQSYYLEVTTDIHERVRMRAMLLEIEKLTSMGKMAAGTAHHLNTPMASLLLRVQMMRARAGENGFAADLQQLEATIGFCQQFIRRLLEFSRRPALEKRPEQMGPLVDAVLGFLAPSFHARQAHVVTDLGAAADLIVNADRNQIETLLIILLSNALDAIPNGGNICIRCIPAGDGELVLEFADDGCGISAADQQRVFEPFFTTKPPGKGTGLGLAIARNIVSEHGGRLSLRSAVGSGTTIEVRLPVMTPRPAEASA